MERDLDVVTYLYQEFRTITTEYLIEWSNSTFTLSQTLRWFPARGIKLNFASEGIIIFVSHGIPSISLSWLNVWINKTPGGACIGACIRQKCTPSKFIALFG